MPETVETFKRLAGHNEHRAGEAQEISKALKLILRLRYSLHAGTVS
jgi:hypothetical protein